MNWMVKTQTSKTFTSPKNSHSPPPPKTKKKLGFPRRFSIFFPFWRPTLWVSQVCSFPCQSWRKKNGVEFFGCCDDERKGTKGIIIYKKYMYIYIYIWQVDGKPKYIVYVYNPGDSKWPRNPLVFGGHFTFWKGSRFHSPSQKRWPAELLGYTHIIQNIIQYGTNPFSMGSP